MDIPVEQIIEPKTLLRPVDERAIEFQELCDSIRDVGQLNSITVRPSPDERYEIVDGMHRYAALREIGHDTVKAEVVEADDRQALLMQLQANACGLETSPVHYARRLRSLLDADSSLTVASLARRLNKSAQWVKNMLGLTNLCEKAANAVDRGEIPLRSGYELGKVPHWLQQKYLSQAYLKTAAEFCRGMRQVVADYRESLKTGRYKEPAGFNPKPYLRPLSQIQEELKSGGNAAAVLAVEGAKDNLSAFRAALKWAIHMDSISMRRFKSD